MENYTQFMKLAIEAARAGGEILLQFYGDEDRYKAELKNPGDWVSAADCASENAILICLQKNVPHHDILTEEAGYIKNGDGEFRWIIDPLDGTTNFLRGFPVWAVSVALERRMETSAKWGEIIAGAIYYPLMGYIYSAARGGGALCSGEPIMLGAGHSFGESLLATGFPFRTRHLAREYNELFTRILLKCADVRRPGSVAVDLGCVAAGLFDGFWELDLGPWDIAAGALIIEEAGGVVRNFQGGADILTTGDIVAGNPRIFDELLEMVREAFPKARDVDKSVG